MSAVGKLWPNAITRQKIPKSIDHHQGSMNNPNKYNRNVSIGLWNTLLLVIGNLWPILVAWEKRSISYIIILKHPLGTMNVQPNLSTSLFYGPTTSVFTCQLMQRLIIAITSTRQEYKEKGIWRERIRSYFTALYTRSEYTNYDGKWKG